VFELPDVADIVARALAEDLGVVPELLLPGAPPDPALLARDVTSAAVVPAGETFAGRIVAREACVACGLPVAERVFSALGLASGLGAAAGEVFPLVAEGAQVAAGTPVAEVSGDAHAILAAERTALDFLMTLSGIATVARRWQDTAGPTLAVCDTRKTVPGTRGLSKYAVRVGGGTNHRAGLWDMVLVKDNHLRRSGGIAQAVTAARAHAPGLRVEVEADTIEQAAEAARAGADIVLLDNMDDATLADAVRAVREASSGGALTEASGGITFERLPAISAAGVDRVSSSALTLAPPVDFGLDESG
jgi:nicotinate-nucleotide pyrophosphorylase (carboxylating)